MLFVNKVQSKKNSTLGLSVYLLIKVSIAFVRLSLVSHVLMNNDSVNVRTCQLHPIQF